jgi:UDP-N-acetylmuramoyl-tripeptide--D-alanyl-D-alanine ligase
MGGIDGVARAKGELVESLSPNGLAILNHDDLRVRSMAARSAAPVLYYGESREPGVEVRIGEVHLDEIARPTFVSTRRGHGAPRCERATHGAQRRRCAGLGWAGGDVHDGRRSLADVGLTAMRMEVHRTASGVTVLNDSYNANPTSMRAALDALAALPATRRVAVLGLMAEIADPEREHRSIVEYARGHGIEVIAYGTELYGIPPVSDALAALGSLAGGEAVLVKGSRVVGLERVAAALLLDEAVDALDVAPPGEQ